MDLSTKLIFTAGAIFAVFFIHAMIGQLYASASEKMKSLIGNFTVFPLTAFSSYRSISSTEDPFWLGHIIGWLMLWSLVFYVIFYHGLKDESKKTALAGDSSDLKQFPVDMPRYTFADVEGMEHLKTALGEQALEIATGQKNGILFYGAPGNGKTFIAEAFAGELNRLLGKKRKFAFMSVSMASLASKWINQTTEQIGDMFAQAAAAAKTQGACVLFIDEIDSLLVDREGLSGTSSEVSQQVNAMLTLVTQYRDFKRHGLVIIAATNFRDRLDEAAIREGRFDFKTEIPAPDFEARISILSRTMQAVTLKRGVAERVARRWEGFGVARIMRVGERTAQLVQKAGRTEVTFEDLMGALREVQGCKGLNLPEGTPSLDDLSFDSALGDSLKQLAVRMTRIADIETLGGTVPKGVLFYGPPGTGKTAVAKALGISSGWAFIPTTGQKILSEANEFDRLVDKALDLRPAIVFIDEADDILAHRATNPYSKAATNNLLAVIDGQRALKDVMFVAATNDENAIDAAAVRGGRFSEMFEFSRPNESALLAIVKSFIREKSSAPWARDFTAEAAAEVLAGLAPADAKDRLQKAINLVVSRLDGREITIEDLRRFV